MRIERGRGTKAHHSFEHVVRKGEVGFFVRLSLGYGTCLQRLDKVSLVEVSVPGLARHLSD